MSVILEENTYVLALSALCVGNCLFFCMVFMLMEDSLLHWPSAVPAVHFGSLH